MGIKTRIILLCLTGFFYLYLNGSCSKISESFSSSEFREKEDIVIIPSMYMEIDKNKTTAYCSTFHMCWKQLEENFVKEPIKLIDGPKWSETLSNPKSVIPELTSGYIAMAGKGPSFVKEVNKRPEITQ